MQPYFLPYLGYWQLLKRVDKFVILDDVQFIKRGWINRNKILNNGQKDWLSIPLLNAKISQNINQIEIVNPDEWRPKMLRKIEYNYKKYPSFDVIYPILEEILNFQNTNLNSFLTNSLKTILEFLQIKVDIEFSSEIDPARSLKAQDRIIEICKKKSATEYFNLPGGIKLYCSKTFEDAGLKLNFIGINYQGFFIDKNHQNLSILHLLMSTASNKLTCIVQ